MKNFIFNPTSMFSNKAAHEEHNLGDEQFFTISGEEDFTDSSGSPRLEKDSTEKTYAKKIIRKDNSYKYLIKLSNNSKLFNPLSIYGIEQDKSFLNRVCRSNKKFKEVNQKAFEWYLKFLTTKNIAWLNNAEREIE
jgi:hypothetical protein